MKVSFLDLSRQYRELSTELDAAYKRVMGSGCYILGPELEDFEKKFSAFCGTQYCIGTGNGFDALKLLLLAYNIGQGDEVIVPAHTFIATWSAVTEVGATLVPTEIDQHTYNISNTALRSKLSEKTKAIIAVHLYGLPANMDPILRIANEANIPVIEDAAQAHNAKYKERVVGGLGDSAAFSFYPAKSIGAFGDAGAITTSNFEIYEKLKSLRNYGASEKNKHIRHGVNSRLDELQAAFLTVKLEYAAQWHTKRSTIASRYSNEILNNRQIIKPLVPSDSTHAWHQYVLYTQHRNSLVEHLDECGVATMIHYPTAIADQVVYRHIRKNNHKTFTQSKNIAENVISIPIDPFMTDDATDHVISSINSFIKQL